MSKKVESNTGETKGETGRQGKERGADRGWDTKRTVTVRRKVNSLRWQKATWHSRHLLLISMSGCNAVFMQLCYTPTTRKGLQAGHQAFPKLDQRMQVRVLIRDWSMERSSGRGCWPWGGPGHKDMLTSTPLRELISQSSWRCGFGCRGLRRATQENQEVAQHWGLKEVGRGEVRAMEQEDLREEVGPQWFS